MRAFCAAYEKRFELIVDNLIAYTDRGGDLGRNQQTALREGIIKGIFLSVGQDEYLRSLPDI